MYKSLFENKYKIYCDMDGVLCDYVSYFKSIFGIHPRKYEIKYGKEKYWEDVSNVDHFFLNLPWIKDSDKMWNMIKTYKPIILTTPAYSVKQCIPDKKRWVQEELGNYKIIFEKHKEDYAEPNAILIDDTIDNIKNWKRKGGIGIRFLSAIQVMDELKRLKIGKI